MSTPIHSMLVRRLGCAISMSLVFMWASCTFIAQDLPGSTSRMFTPEAVRASVAEIAAIVGREYVDPAIASRLAEALRRRLREGEYAAASTPEALASRVTRDLLTESGDKHLAVSVVRLSGPSARASSPTARADGVRRTNGGVRRVEILPGNVGYLDLTSFWRLEEAQDPLSDAMSLLRRADALIVDMRQNGGGSPETVAFLAGYLFEKGGLPLFDIASRSDAPRAYATPTPAPDERDERRAVYVLTSSKTFSAGEGLAFLLQERGRARVIGERTAGAANPGRAHRVNQWLEVTVPNGKVRSAVNGKNWEGVGVTPDVSVPAADALRAAHLGALRALVTRTLAGAWRDALDREIAVLERAR